MKLATRLANLAPCSAEEIAAICNEEGLIVDRPVVEADYEEIARFLELWCAIADADASHPEGEETRAALTNALLSEYSGHPRLSSHDGWHLHYRDDDVTFARMVQTVIIVGTALHLTSRGMDRLGRCASVSCTNVFADTTRNGRQRFCSTRCNNRDAQRRFREEHRK
ncbi:CGNR zinc finger domain-containing protein [uncultured Agrococcus sp.]|uniref:CGNR zinc finger domain-containing protein n=1 Tax=uncultured Agrococcus sp. TaxID=382258 RepID=UPI0025E3F220|nr:CGNR zinc finger domain-containing protein [uncultured Agrococcus sp.]